VSNYFHTILPNVSYKAWVVFFGLSSAVISNAGLNAILKFSIPILNAIYPLAISLIVVGLFNMDKKESFRISRKLMMSVVGIFSVGPVLFNLFNAGAVFDALPLYDMGLVWLIPGIVALFIGYLIQKVFLKEN
jgi:LIVCS family branched-chain amino acid:cation transporter